MAESSSQFGPSVQRDRVLTRWLELAAQAFGEIGERSIRRLERWMRELGDQRAIQFALRQAVPIIHSDDLVELNHQATFVALLRGMLATAEGGERDESKARRANARESSLFAKLPFREAIDALAERLSLIKRPGYLPAYGIHQGEVIDLGVDVEPTPSFLELDAANRSRAFTMAKIQDLHVLQNVHDELVESIAEGETFDDFFWRLESVTERTGWTGTSSDHARLVYNQNLSMAYSAGRFEQGSRTGFRVVRILPTLSQSPRPEHARYAGQMFRMGPRSVLPPWDFGCNCGWEWVFPEELESAGMNPEALPELDFDFGDQEFRWNQTAYMALTVPPGAYSGTVASIARDL